MLDTNFTAVADASRPNEIVVVMAIADDGRLHNRCPPPARLWSDPRVLITPQTSSISDADRHGGVGIFWENLRAHLDGKPMRNALDWQRGY